MKKAVIIDARYADLAEKAWGNEFDIIPSAACENVDSAISYHPDVSVLKVGGTLVCAPCVYEYYKKALLPYGIKPAKGALDPNCHYPEDCAYNIAITKSCAFFKEGVIDKKAAELIRENNLREIYVNQGYSKCSCVCLPNGIITADTSIFKAAEKEGVPCLKIKEGEVRLEPYPYGFLGGASGYNDGEVFFFGDITMHSDFKAIKEFLNNKKIKIRYIKNYPLVDIGTIIFP